MLCTGVAELMLGPERPPFRLGGLELVDLREGHPLHRDPYALPAGPPAPARRAVA